MDYQTHAALHLSSLENEDTKLASDGDTERQPTILVIEPFYGGSHKQLIDLIKSEVAVEMEIITLPAKKWHWRARTAALYLSQCIPHKKSYRVLFTTSVLNLSELISLRPDLAKLHKVVYFHENQLVYPVQKVKERDFQYGYNQILTALVADKVVFNSKYNRQSFLSGIGRHLKMIPDYRPSSNEIIKTIEQKSSVIYFPLQLAEISIQHSLNSDHPLIILWPHRWEHDKAPEIFFNALYKLNNEGLDFRISILGESFSDIPSEFDEAKINLSDKILRWGYLESKIDYYKALKEADVVVSTATHEFYGVGMLEAVYFGCYPLCPNRLVYPEIFPSAHLYNTENQLYKLLRRYCKNPSLVRQQTLDLNLDQFTWTSLKSTFTNLLTLSSP
ncbi:GTDC1 (predicted) [Pycnogonum litorale]